MRNNEEEGGEGHSERWLVTYSDMITLLLVLFIMMYTMASIDADKYDALSEQLGIVLNPSSQMGSSGSGSGSGSGEGNGTGADTQTDTDTQSDAGIETDLSSLGDSSYLYHMNLSEETPDSLEEKLNSLIESSGYSQFATVHVEERGIVVCLVEGLLFPSGSAQINNDAKDMLNKICVIANSVDNYIRVEGSTDDVNINTSQFPSNWELASQRAINVAKLLVEQGVDPSRISAVSYGEYRPTVPNDSEENRQLNRRVDIVFINQDLNAYEPGQAQSSDGGTANP